MTEPLLLDARHDRLWSGLPVPSKFAAVVGRSEGSTKLNAFDGALLQAGIGNLNLLKVSSVVPPGCVAVAPDDLGAPPGSLVPTAYETESSTVPGENIAAAVAVGLSEGSYGMIMEYAGKCTRREAEETVAAMVEEAFATRSLPLHRVILKGIEHRVVRCGCVVAAVAMWY